MLKSFYHFIAKKTPKFIKKNICKVVNVINVIRNSSRVINFSLRVNKKRIYIIRRKNTTSGFFSNYLYVLGHIMYCEKKGYIPIVDMENYLTPYNENKKIFGTCNSWEYYFYQPTRTISLEKAYSSKNAILSANKYFHNFVGVYEILDEDRIRLLNSYISKYIIIKDELINEFNNIFNELLGNSEGKILAVHIRGTDMISTANHPTPPTIETYMKEVDKILSTGRYTKILLCTDDENSIFLFKERYGNMLIITNSLRSNDGVTPPHKMRSIRDNHNYKLGKEVLQDMYFLSKADSLICCFSNVSYVAIIINNCRYENVINLSSGLIYKGSKKLN